MSGERARGSRCSSRFPHSPPWRKGEGGRLGLHKRGSRRAKTCKQID